MSDLNDTPAPMMRNPSFRWMLAGAAISMLGDQFTLMALPWLVLKMTGSSMALGLAIALVSVPGAMFILLGGAMVDRHSPKRVLLASKLASAALLGTLALLVLTHQQTLTLVYALALAIGLASAFGIPSATSLLPHVVAPAQLEAANGITLAIRQLTFLAGPLLAGFLIAFAGHGAEAAPVSDTTGLGLAFAFDCLSFAVSALTLTRVRLRGDVPRNDAQNVWRAIGSGLAMVWNDSVLRTCFAYWALIACVTGGIQVAMPMLASERFHGTAALGILLGANGAGTLIGMLASGRNLRLRVGSLGSTMLLIDGTLGVLLMPLGHITAVWQGAALLLAGGILGGFMQVAVFTWIQRRVPRAMLGRAMSMLMFIFTGIAPLSAAVAGWLMQGITVAQLFGGIGAALMIVALAAYVLSPMRQVNDSPIEETGRL